MKNHILASIALFGIYRNNNQDTYDLLAQYISAVIAQNELISFTPANVQEGLKDLYQIEIPIGVIKSVCKNKIEGVFLNNGVFTCTRIPKDEIEKEYNELSDEYEELFVRLLSFVRERTDEFDDQFIKDCFGDYLTEGITSETDLNNLYAAFISSTKDDKLIRQKIDLLSSGLISYNGLSYADSAGNSGAWVDKLTIYLDTEFLFSCAGYNDNYHKDVFLELYNLVKEVNQSYRRRTKKEDDLIELKYLEDTRDVYMSLLGTAKSLIETKGAPDPSKKALMKIVQESLSITDVIRHQSIIDSAIKDTYHIVYDDRDYSNLVTDPRYVSFDEKTISDLNVKYNPDKDENKRRKIDYYARVYTIIKGLRGGKEVSVFENCRYIFLTGSRIGRGASLEVRNDHKTVTLATDIDFVVSRLWFKLNKQLVNNRIPVSLDIVARSQAVLTRAVSRKVRDMFEELKETDLSLEEKRMMYANLKEAGEFLAPYNDTSTKDVLSFIEYTHIDELIEANHNLRKKADVADRAEKELSDVKETLAERNAEISELKLSMAEIIKDHKEFQENNKAHRVHLGRIIKLLVLIVVVLIVALVFALLLK